MTLHTALVGLGWWGRQIVSSLAESEIVSILRVVEPRVVENAEFAKAHGLLLGDNLDEALTDEAVQAVIIATPHALHEEQVIAAAGSGRHVFCEKPLALSSAAARRMVDASRQGGLKLGVGHERRFEGALEEARRMVLDEELGTLLHLECHWSHNLFTQSEASEWRRDPRQAPAGTLTALGVHITDYFQSVAGPVAELTATTANRSPDYPGDDVLTVQFRFRSGVTGSLANLATTPFYSRITIFGDRGWVEAREYSNVDVPEDAILEWHTSDGEAHNRTFPPTNTVKANIEQWAASALGTGHYRFSDEELVHNIEILEAIVESAATGAPVAIG